MKKYFKIACVIPAAFVLAPVLADAVETEAATTLPTYYLHNDVRVITFSNPIDPSSLKDITLFDETLDEPIKTIAEIGENPKQLKISLAVNEQYENRHVYSLTLKGVKNVKSGKAMKETVLNFKMLEKVPEPLSFAKSYVVSNTSNSGQYFELPAGASYVAYDAYGVHKHSDENGVNIPTAKRVYLEAGERMTVSFFTNEVLTASEGFKVEPTTNNSHIAYKLYKNSSVKVEGQAEDVTATIHFGNATQPSAASYAQYSPKREVVDFKYNVTNEQGLTSTTLHGLNDVVITNEQYEELYVYAPKTIYNLTNIEHIEEQAVEVHELQRYEILQANTTEPTYNTELQYTVPEGEWRISGVTYKEDRVLSTLYKHQTALPVHSNGDTLIKNEVGLPLTVSGPGRYVTFDETTEQPLTIRSLIPDEKIKVTSKLQQYYDVFLDDTAATETFSNIHMFNDIVQAANLNKELVGDHVFNIGGNHSQMIENTSEQNLTLYAAARPTIIEPYAEALFTSFNLAPNEQITVESSKETKLYLQDLTKTGAYNFTKNGATSDVTFEYTTNVRTDFDANETITIENTGPVPLTLYAKTGEVSYTK